MNRNPVAQSSFHIIGHSSFLSLGQKILRLSGESKENRRSRNSMDKNIVQSLKFAETTGKSILWASKCVYGVKISANIEHNESRLDRQFVFVGFIFVGTK